MPKLTQIGRHEARIIGDRAVALLKALEQELGIAVSYSGGMLNGTSATLKFQFALMNGEGQAETKEAKYFKMFASQHGLQPEDLYKEFRFRTKTYKITGLAMQAAKYPILATDANGRGFKFGVNMVLVGLGRPSLHSPLALPAMDDLGEGMDA